MSRWIETLAAGHTVIDYQDDAGDGMSALFILSSDGNGIAIEGTPGQLRKLAAEITAITEEV